MLTRNEYYEEAIEAYIKSMEPSWKKKGYSYIEMNRHLRCFEAGFNAAEDMQEGQYTTQA